MIIIFILFVIAMILVLPANKQNAKNDRPSGTQSSNQRNYNSNQNGVQGNQPGNGQNGRPVPQSTVAYTKTHTRSQKTSAAYVVTPVEDELVLDSKERSSQGAIAKNKNRHESKRVDVTVTVDGRQPEYQATYGTVGETYQYIAKYPDTSHIWDGINTKLSFEGEDVIVCPKCKTHNIVVKNTSGKCQCYYCGEELL